VYQLTSRPSPLRASGAYIERMKFSPGSLHRALVHGGLPAVAHWVWGGGFLAKLGALDFAGGTVVHVNAASRRSWAPRPRKRREKALLPGNLTLVITGRALWFGWFGFNGARPWGERLAGAAFINTNTRPRGGPCLDGCGMDALGKPGPGPRVGRGRRARGHHRPPGS